MTPSVAQMRSFIAIAKQGSFTRAARSLHLSQPALTVQIRQLEQALKVRLIDRNTRSVALTRIGRELVPILERLLGELDTVVSNARDLSTRQYGIVRVACLPSIAATVMPSAIAAFKVRHPGVQFNVRDGVGGKILALLRSDAVDFGITAGEVNDPEFKTSVLMRDHMHAVYLAPHPLHKEKKITPEKLSRFPLILMDEESTVRQLVDRAFRLAGVSAKPIIEATYMATAVGMVQARLGVAILPSAAIEARPAGRLKSKPIEGKHFTRPIFIVQKAGRSLPPASESFLTTLKSIDFEGRV
jgi:DNA-binding transcriptional LysR family regulator